MQETEKKLSGILYERGINDNSFAVIRSKGDQALFRLSTATLKRKMNVPASRPLAVRRILLERGVVPEDLPAEEDVKKVERRLASEIKKAIENKQKK